MKYVLTLVFICYSLAGYTQRCGPASFYLTFVDNEGKVIAPDITIVHQSMQGQQVLKKLSGKELQKDQFWEGANEIIMTPELERIEQEFYVKATYQHKVMHLNFMLCGWIRYIPSDTITICAGNFIYLPASPVLKQFKSKLIKYKKGLPEDICILPPGKAAQKSDELLLKNLDLRHTKHFSGLVYSKHHVPYAYIEATNQKLKKVSYLNKMYVSVLQKYIVRQ